MTRQMTNRSHHMKTIRNITIILLSILLSSCATTLIQQPGFARDMSNIPEYTQLEQNINSGTISFTEYVSGWRKVTENNFVTNQTGFELDKYSVSFFDNILSMAESIDRGKYSSVTFFDYVNRQKQGIMEWYQKDLEETTKQAQTALAAIAVGVAVGAAANNYNGGGGGSYYSTPSNSSGYPGPCPCPYDTASDGSLCGARSAYSRSGGYSPVCY